MRVTWRIGVVTSSINFRLCNEISRHTDALRYRSSRVLTPRCVCVCVCTDVKSDSASKQGQFLRGQSISQFFRSFIIKEKTVNKRSLVFFAACAARPWLPDYTGSPLSKRKFRSFQMPRRLALRRFMIDPCGKLERDTSTAHCLAVCTACT